MSNVTRTHRSGKEKSVPQAPSAHKARPSSATTRASKKVSFSEKPPFILQAGHALLKKATAPSVKSITEHTSGAENTSGKKGHVSGIATSSAKTHTSGSKKKAVSKTPSQSTIYGSSGTAKASVTRKKISRVHLSHKPSAPPTRTASIKSSAVRKITTENRARSEAKTSSRLKSTSRIRSEASRKYGTVDQKYASTKKQSVTVTEPVSSAKSDLVSKSGTGKCLPIRNKPSSYHRALVQRKIGGPACHHDVHPHVVIAPPPPAVVIIQKRVNVAPPPPIPPVAVRPRDSCRYCCCDINDVCLEKRRTKCCFDCSTRRGHC